MFPGLKLLLWTTGALLGVVTLAAAFAGGLYAAAVVGSPGPCQPAAPLVVTGEAAASLQAKLDTMTAQLAAGQPASFAFTDSELTSRAVQFLREEDAPIRDLQVCVHAGAVEASGTVQVPWGPDVDVLARGRVDFSGGEPQVRIDSMEVGAVPGLVTGTVEGIIGGLIEEQLRKIDLEYHYQLALGEGAGTLSALP